MRLGRAAAYGLLAMLAIADRSRDGGITAREISMQSGVPVEYLRKILQRLTRARLVRSERGRCGGFRLHKPLRNITLLHVIEAIDGPIDQVAFLDEGLLDGRALPAFHRLKQWRSSAAAQFRAMLRETSLDDILPIRTGNGRHSNGSGARSIASADNDGKAHTITAPRSRVTAVRPRQRAGAVAR